MLLGTLPQAMTAMLAPLPNFFYGKVSTRKMAILGIIATSAGLAMPALATCRTLVPMMVMYGVLAGVGGSLVVNPPFFLLAEYFPYKHPRHVLATSVAALSLPLGKPTHLTYIVISCDFNVTRQSSGIIRPI